MKILLTGGTGLLGSHILEQGLSRGVKFHTLTRKISKRSYLSKVIENKNIKNFEHDLINSEFSREIFEGVDIVIHSAAMISQKESDQVLMRRINIEASQNLYNAAIVNNVKKWIQISSIATMSNGEDDSVIKEQDHGKFRKTNYPQSKYDFDNWLNEQDAIPHCTIHPCFLLGKYDSKPSSGAFVFALKLRKIKHLFNTHKNFVSAHDVARAIYIAIEKKALGRYIIGGENLPISQFVNLIGEKLNIEDFGIKYHSHQSNISLLPHEEQEFMKEFSLSNAVSIEKAERELNFFPELTCSEALDELIDYFVQNKMLRIVRKS